MRAESIEPPRRTLRWVSLLTLGALAGTSGCKKDPSPAQRALEQFAEAVVRHTPTEDLVFDEGNVGFELTGGEPEDGEINALPPPNLGVVDWARSSLESERVLPSGDRRVEIIFNVCLRAENQDRCTRPSRYRYRALMRQDEGVWKVAGSTCAVEFEVR